ncbi:MAG: dTMP kinase [bacterium]|nr:dTMP kinase [bacterium]MDD5756274.1 dTMP kinase [bacterium]
MKYPGIFITLEGPDGSGKSTQALLLIKFLKKSGYQVLHTREPGGDRVAESIRRLLLSPYNKITPETELFLYWASRSQHVQQVINPALARGVIVICERFNDATLAYQGYGRGVDLKLIKKMNQLASGGLIPDLTFLLDIAPERGLKKVLEAKGVKDRFELEKLSFHKRVRKGYLELANQEPQRIKKISGSGTIEHIQQQIRCIINKKLGQ